MNTKTPVPRGCSECGKDSYGRRFKEDAPKRHRRSYLVDGRVVCGYCVKKFGLRTGK